MWYIHLVSQSLYQKVTMNWIFHYKSKPLPGYLQDFCNPCCDACKHNFVSSSRPEYDVTSTWYFVSVSSYLRWRRKKHRMMQVWHTLHNQPDHIWSWSALWHTFSFNGFSSMLFFYYCIIIFLYKTTTLWRNTYGIVNIAIFFTKYIEINILTILWMEWMNVGFYLLITCLGC